MQPKTQGSLESQRWWRITMTYVSHPAMSCYALGKRSPVIEFARMESLGDACTSTIYTPEEVVCSLLRCRLRPLLGAVLCVFCWACDDGNCTATKDQDNL